ncbi:hypothetical protein TSAR_007510 [Trichomalopsis sarcophagae]|uniref:Uncharacterized protein n=1 Tax=Trichomalopsis sarcophagae TaxID=543379 RepID=A0A232ENX9_9HYME|nr:hypothetical protein TSAR_007510 [Trichomalopsis sarcophagae]
MVLNMYNKKQKVAGVCPNICFFFSVSPIRKWHCTRRIPHIHVNVRSSSSRKKNDRPTRRESIKSQVDHRRCASHLSHDAEKLVTT